MSFKGYKHLRGSPEEDEATLVNEGKNSKPATLVYVPESGSFDNDSATVYDGQAASSSQALKGLSRGEALGMSVQQLRYNENKVALDRAINRAIDLIFELLSENKERPIHYPAGFEDDLYMMLNSPRAKLALTRSILNSGEALGGGDGKEAKTGDSGNSDDSGNNGSSGASDFKVLKLNLKIGHDKGNRNLVKTLDKVSVATLLEQKFNQQTKYLLNLKDRVDDTSSKVFVTGDLNAGKSTFCNGLLRRRILPEDQQPCTSVFCEVIDASKENKGIEEVHAVPIGNEYDIRDESSYEIHPLKSLENLVYECDRFSLLKVYVLDGRSFEESLLHNGVIDIKLIDAPGLNMDLYQTTQVFSRQEEIDLVVFVVNAENHFTLSAKEFIAAAAGERRYVFIVVNKFDNIMDQEKCKSKILEQIKQLSPDSYKDANEFVHFVSSSEVSSGQGKPDGGDGGDGGDDGHDPRNGPHRRGNPDFDHLEASLRKFLLEKRAISKLLPAKDYLSNLLHDIRVLSAINKDLYDQEINKKKEELTSQTGPKYESVLAQSGKVSDQINKIIERTCTEVYNSTRSEILETVSNFGDNQIIHYPGLQYVYEYALATQKAIIETVLSSVSYCESQARILTSDRVDEIVKLGQASLGEDFLSDKVLSSDLMFTRRRDTIKKNLSTPIEIGDFFDPSWESFLFWLGVPQNLVSYTKDQVNAYNPTNILSSIPISAISLKKQLPTQITLHTLYSSTKLLTTGALLRKAYSASYLLTPSVLKKVGIPVLLGITGFTIYYLINDIPNAFPRKQARKIKSLIIEMDYSHVNADRISKECRQVLNFPSRSVMAGFQTSIDKNYEEKARLEKCIKDAQHGSIYFLSLLKKVASQVEAIESIDLESLNTVD